jgi:hypothetical protein
MLGRGPNGVEVEEWRISDLQMVSTVGGPIGVLYDTLVNLKRQVWSLWPVFGPSFARLLGAIWYNQDSGREMPLLLFAQFDVTLWTLFKKKYV